MRLHIITILALAVLSGSCTMQFLVADTASDKIVEFGNDYYVAYSQDSVLEFHYDLWSVNATIWLSVLNRSEDLVVIQPDSCFLMVDGVRYWFDQYQDWGEYVQPMLNDSVVTLIDPEKYLPLMPGQWKGFLGPELYFKVDDWKSMSEGVSFSREESPITINISLCYISETSPGQTRCEEHTIWVEHLQYFRGRDFQALDDDKEFTTSDKFYLFNLPGVGAASILGVVVPLLFVL